MKSTSTALSQTLRIFTILHLALNITSSLHIKIFKDIHFKGLIYEAFHPDPDPTDEEGACFNVKPYAQGTAGSIELDKCVIAYESLDCEGLSRKVTPTSENLTEFLKPVFSYFPCNASYGGKTNRVDFYGAEDVLLGEYPNICGCQDLPTQVSSDAMKLHNYGNCIKLYQTDSCGGTSLEIPGGRNEFSDDLTLFPHFPRSISACGSRPECITLHAHVFKFVLLDEPLTQQYLQSNERKVELATATTFYNNGSATVSQVYQASKTLTETFSVNRFKTFTNVQRSTVDKTVVTQHQEGFWFWSRWVTNTLREAYTVENIEETKENETYTKEESKTFAITQTIEIPPCAEYQVSSMVTIIENLPISFEVHMKVTGRSSGRRMSSKEIQDVVEDMEYLEDVDEYTPIFKMEQVLLANVGVDTFISGEGHDIEGCSIRRPMSSEL